MKKNLQTRFSTRQYMLSRDFEIYYYNDRALSEVKDHAHDYYEFYFFLEGNVSMQVNGEQYPLKYGDLVLIPPGIGHHAVIRDGAAPYRRFVFWISREYCSQLLEVSPAYGYLMQHAIVTGRYVFHHDRIAFNTIQSKMFRLIEEIHGQRFGKEAQVSLCVSDLLLHLNRLVYESSHTKSRGEEQSLYENLIGYIEEHLDEELTLEKLAGEFYVNKYHIAHVFKEQMGLSVHQYITKKRVAACREAILNREKIGRIYGDFGFRDYSSFYRAFKKEYGQSPKEYRETAGALSGERKEQKETVL